MKIVLDTSVVLNAVYSSKSSASTSSRRIFDLLISGELEVFTCDVFLGEILRVVSTDPKLSKVKPPYLEARIDEYLKHTIVVSIEEVNKVRMSPNFQLFKNGTMNENDMYLIALSIAKKVEYLLTYDKDVKAISVATPLSIVDPAEFLHLERKRFS